jgi:hypothetical protein
MEIVFSLTEEDILALAKFRNEKVPLLQKRARRVRYGYLIGFAIMGVGLWLSTSDLIYLILFSLLSLVSFLFYPQYYSWRMQMRVREVYRDKKYRAALAPRTWRIGADGLEESSAVGEIKVKWDNIDQIFVTATGAFVSVMHMPEMVIPKERVVQGDYEGFVAALQARIQGEQG